MRIETILLNNTESKALNHYEFYCWMGFLFTYFILGCMTFGFDQAIQYFNQNFMLKAILVLVGHVLICTGLFLAPGTWLQVFNNKRNQVLYAAGWSGAFPRKITAALK